MCIRDSAQVVACRRYLLLVQGGVPFKLLPRLLLLIPVSYTHLDVYKRQVSAAAGVAAA
ncbi:hypothetical protein [Erwinia amylovora]